MRKLRYLRNPLDLPGSASRTSSLRNKRPSTQTKSIDPRAQPLLPHTDKQDNNEMSLLMLLCSLLMCHFLDTKQMRSRMLTSFCQLHKKKRSKTHVVTKSLYIMTWFVCLNKFECLKNVETFLGFQTNSANVSMMSPSDLLATPVLNHRETYQTRASSNCVPFILDK